MRRTVRRTLRILATGLSFVVFGVGCIILVFVIFPVVWITSVTVEKRRLTSRRVISFSFRLFIRMMRLLGLITYNIRNLEQIKGSCLVVSNHPTLIDVVFLLGWIENASCILKSGLFRNPVTLGPVAAAGYLDNDSTDLLNECLQSLENGCPLLVFPEGTRTRPGEEMSFQRGAANIALAGGTEIVLVTIAVDPVTLIKYQPWWAVPSRTPHYEIEFQDRWNAKSYLTDDRRSRQARNLTHDLEQYYINILAIL